MLKANSYAPGPSHSVVKPYFENRARFFDEMRSRYGPVVHFKIGLFHITLVTDPEDIRQVLTDRGSRKTFITKLLLWPVIGNGLLISEGDFYLRQRRLIQPAFHRKRLAIYGRVATEAAVTWRETLRDGSEIEMEKEMMGLTLDVVGRSLFGSEMGHEAQRIARALDAFYGLVDWVVALGPLAFLIPNPRSLRFFWCLIQLRHFVERLIKERRDSEPQDDLLSMLLGAQEDGRRMSHSQVRGEALTLLLAGHETTAVAMTWTWYLLSQHPEIEARLHHELDTVLEGRPPNMEDLESLPYTKQVLAESMRLYPPAYMLDRHPSEDIFIRGYRVPRGSYIFVSPYATHRDPALYADPERFDPDRWLPEREQELPRFAYLPFGVGPRACIGQSFAWIEASLALATVAQQWRFELCPGQVVDTNPKVTLRPRYGMRMTARRRATIS